MSRNKSAIYEAATLILLARSSQRASKSANNLQPRAAVFPGGMIDKADFSDDWKNIYQKEVDWLNLIESLPKTCDPRTSLYTRSRDSSLTTDIGLRISAIRETFEESGILLLRSLTDGLPESNSGGTFASTINISSEELNKWRVMVRENATRFMDLCRELQALPDIWSLYEWNNWFTPPGFKKRFNTSFFVCCTEQMDDVSEDAREVTKTFWTPPLGVLQQFASKKLLLFPPQNVELSRLLKYIFVNLTIVLFSQHKFYKEFLISFSSVEEVLKFSYNRARNHPTLLHLPILVKCKDGNMTVMPGDSLYPLDLLSLQNYEGEAPGEDAVLINRNSETIEQVNSSSENMYRCVFHEEYSNTVNPSHDTWSTLYCNINTADGHKPPQLF
ncbi:Nucleoside diphosphate-linked moiety X motif 19 [Trichoplax sp. H2]|nr:Nucleoside diphosphate-linked moiety X motif 19 [Trichoplax sp. H2]|eukprot:RDD41096.1 Nucleoside diphosphate-linked moiety X motif 19 [Trichoplax sp. H2]